MFENEPNRTEFILWNTSSKELETQFNGRFVCFAPNEEKSFGDRDDVLNHVHMKLDRYGVVKIKKNGTKEEKNKAILDGLKARHKTLRFVIEQFQSSNKAREAKMQSPEMPTDYVSECVVEDQAIMDKIKELEGYKANLVNDYFKNIEAKEKEILEVTNTNEKVVVTASGATIEKRKAGRPPKVKNDIPSAEVAGIN